jgi:hypothetical protein
VNKRQLIDLFVFFTQRFQLALCPKESVEENGSIRMTQNADAVDPAQSNERLVTATNLQFHFL